MSISGNVDNVSIKTKINQRYSHKIEENAHKIATIVQNTKNSLPTNASFAQRATFPLDKKRSVNQNELIFLLCIAVVVAELDDNRYLLEPCGSIVMISVFFLRCSLLLLSFAYTKAALFPFSHYFYTSQLSSFICIDVRL